MGSAAGAEIQLSVGGGVRHDDNLFRRSEASTDALGVHHTDNIYSLDGILTASAHPLDTDVALTLTGGRDWYQRNSRLNNFNYSLNSSFARTEGVVQFNLLAQSRRFLSSFGDIRVQRANIQQLQSLSGQITYAITPQIRVVALPTFLMNTNTLDAIKVNDYRQYGASVGLGYYSSLGNSLSFTVGRQHTDGLHSRPVFLTGIAGEVNAPIDTDDTLIGAHLLYNLGQFTSVLIDATYDKRNDKSALNNDYSGPTADVNVFYRPTERTTFSVSAGRILESQSLLFIDSARTDFVRGSVLYQIIDRLAAKASVQYSHRRLEFDPVELADRDARLDNTLSFNLNATYRLFGRLDVGGLVSHQRRTGNVANREFTDTQYGLTARVVFGSQPLSETVSAVLQ